MKLDRPTLVKKIIFLNGITRSGKFLLGNLISGLEDIDFFNANTIVELLPQFQQYGLMDEHTTRLIMQIAIDEQIYHLRIGRNLNSRVDDKSSLSHPSGDYYIKKSQTLMSDKLIKEVKESKRVPVFILHNSLINIQTYLKIYPELKWIQIVRHPVNLINSWYRRGLGDRSHEDSLMLTPLSKGVPLIASKWKDYYKMNTMDRVIKYIHTLTEMEEKGYRGFSDKSKILFIQYERLVQETKEEIERVSTFLNSKFSKDMILIMKRENCPKTLPNNDLQELEIRCKASDKMNRVLTQMIGKYNN